MRQLLYHLNACEFDEAGRYLTDDVSIVDIGGSRIDGREACLERDRQFREHYGNPKGQVDSLSHNNNEVLARGWLDSENPEIKGESFWRFCFEGDRICLIETMREGHRVTLPRFRPRVETGDKTGVA